MYVKSDVFFDSLRMYDTTGREVYRELLPAGFIPDYQTNLTVANFPEGIYTLSALQGEQRSYQKVLISR